MAIVVRVHDPKDREMPLANNYNAVPISVSCKLVISYSRFFAEEDEF